MKAVKALLTIASIGLMSLNSLAASPVKKCSVVYLNGPFKLSFTQYTYANGATSESTLVSEVAGNKVLSVELSPTKKSSLKIIKDKLQVVSSISAFSATGGVSKEQSVTITADLKSLQDIKPGVAMAEGSISSIDISMEGPLLISKDCLVK
ncbi:MAG: hypothetical protein OM95_00520 [Bdellovibrio sp. ArHS]|uniref:hypothetical protein n=1 Tax=Bdellovibrio sp. ArHS TaxID=1569284 RepID=UPI0005828181|nr:hypothetical protein [Bdellovibrio sp. ArHS]KHD90038.1 MAG: hypothetical protein OM95_00520 [Bdellovibrio sp. ArHS]